MRWKSPQLTSEEVDIVIRALEHRGSAYDLRLAAKLMRANGLYATAANTETEASRLEQMDQEP